MTLCDENTEKNNDIKIYRKVQGIQRKKNKYVFKFRLIRFCRVLQYLRYDYMNKLTKLFFNLNKQIVKIYTSLCTTINNFDDVIKSTKITD